MSITVSDVMGRTAIAVRQDAGFADIVATMRRFAVGAVTVVDADRRPVGWCPRTTCSSRRATQ